MGEMAATGPEEVERLKQEIIRLTQVSSVMKTIVRDDFQGFYDHHVTGVTS